MIFLISAVPPIKNISTEKNVGTNELTSIKIQQVLDMTPKQYEQMTGMSMSWKEKIAFSMLKSNLKKDAAKFNNTINLPEAVAESTSDFSWGGFFTGFLLGLIGVGLVYIFSTDPGVRSSAWKGLGVWVLLLLLLVLSAPKS
jgi:sulfite exporter TauE/SafE